METDLKRIKRLAEEKEEENWDFRYFLKSCSSSPEEIDKIVQRIYRKAAAAIDCKACGNCCREVRLEVDREDIGRLAKAVNLTEQDFIDKYLVKYEMSDKFVSRDKPCPFLNGNLCSHYESRAKGCRSYPYLDREGFVFRLLNIVTNVPVCPIIYNVFEYLKKEEL